MNDYDRAAAILRRECGSSRNRVTPNVLSRVLVAPGVAVELAEGPSRMDGTTRRAGSASEEPLRSGLFRSREAAERRIGELKELAGWGVN